jgi:uncharacterized protein YigA (DUF484 family)
MYSDQLDASRKKTEALEQKVKTNVRLEQENKRLINAFMDSQQQLSQTQRMLKDTRGEFIEYKKTWNEARFQSVRLSGWRGVFGMARIEYK